MTETKISDECRSEIRPMSLTYVGSFLDGEGCIVFGKTKKWNATQQKYYPSTTIRMEICNTDFEIVEDIHKFMGIGHIIDIKPRVTAKGTTTKTQKRWQTTHRQTYKALKKLLPYMREKNKRSKAMEVIEYYESEQPQKGLARIK
tara:strand:+ start:113 stop:547 length:435 start_codon:yes stop_codon:yes gene_type:complete